MAEVGLSGEFFFVWLLRFPRRKLNSLFRSGIGRLCNWSTTGVLRNWLSGALCAASNSSIRARSS